MVDSSLGSGDKKNTLKLIYYRHWMVLSVIAVLLLATLLWSFFGKIAVRTNGKGIILPDSKGIYAISSFGSGVINEVKIHVNQKVKKGEVIAVVDQTNLQLQIDKERENLNILEEDFRNIRTLASKHISLTSDLYMQNDTVLSEYKKDSEKYLEYLKNLAKDEKELAEKGYIAYVRYKKLEKEVSKLSLQLKQHQSKKTQNDIQLNNTYLKIGQMITALQKQINTQKALLALHMKNFQESKYITAEKSGYVLSVNIAPGQYISTGSVAVTIATGKVSIDHFIAFFDSLTYSRLIKKNMKVYIVPSFLSQYLYGSIKGKVLKIDRYPQSTNAINAIVNNSTLTKYISKNNVPMLLAKVKLETNKSTPSGYSWTTHKGAPFKIPLGTICNTTVIVKYIRPISLVLPFIRKTTRMFM